MKTSLVKPDVPVPDHANPVTGTPDASPAATSITYSPAEGVTLPGYADADDELAAASTGLPVAVPLKT